MLDRSQCLPLLKPLHGLCEAGDLWHKTLERHHRENLKMSGLRLDPALYELVANAVLHGLRGGYVDELIKAADRHFRRVAQGTREKFDLEEDIRRPCIFSGFALTRSTDGSMQNGPVCVPAPAREAGSNLEKF